MNDFLYLAKVQVFLKLGAKNGLNLLKLGAKNGLNLLKLGAKNESNFLKLGAKKSFFVAAPKSGHEKCVAVPQSVLFLS